MFIYHGFKIGNRDDLETVTAMPDVSLKESFESCLEKRIQNKSVWWTNKLNKLRNTRNLRKALPQNVPAPCELYREAQSGYKKAVRSAKVNNWKHFYEFVDKIPELTRARKILAKYRGAIKKPLQFPINGLARILKEALGILLHTHFPGTKITLGPEMEPKSLKSNFLHSNTE